MSKPTKMLVSQSELDAMRQRTNELGGMACAGLWEITKEGKRIPYCAAGFLADLKGSRLTHEAYAYALDRQFSWTRFDNFFPGHAFDTQTRIPFEQVERELVEFIIISEDEALRLDQETRERLRVM